MQVNGLTNFFGNLSVTVNRPNDTVQQPVQVVETSSPVSVQGDAGRRVAATSSADGSQASNTPRDRLQQELEQQIIRELASRDREVRQHEMAHQMVGGQYTGSASYTFERGPDGVMYAIGGEVSIDTSPVPGDPQATLQKAQTIEKAAMAPAAPSPQDLKVAASARAMANEARAELLKEQQESLKTGVLDDDVSAYNIDDLNTTKDNSLKDGVDENSPFEGVSIENNQLREQQEQARRLELQQAELDASERRAKIDETEEARKERREAIAEEQQLRRERSAEALREFALNLAEIQAQLQELNKRLLETGALQGRTTLGSILDRQA